MPTKQNALTGEGKGVCQLGGDMDAHSTNTARRQAVLRCGVPSQRADLVARLAFGDFHGGAA